MNNQKLKENATYLRNNSTLSEILLWKRLRNKQIRNCKFLRQKVIENYIVDFYCHQLKLIIEIDGSSHCENEKKDQEKDGNLKNLGINILRISDSRVKNNINGVIWEIEDWIDSYG